MKFLLYAFVGLFCFCLPTWSKAQKQYMLEHSIGQYESISNGTIISAPDNPPEIHWDENGYVFQFEQPFFFPDVATPYTAGIVTTNGEVIVLGDQGAVTRILSPLFMDLVDKRIFGSGDASDIVLAHENNITKIEWVDASNFCSVLGLRETEGITFSIWFYHNTGIFEYRYGSNTLSEATEGCLFAGFDLPPDIGFIDLSPSLGFIQGHIVTGMPEDPQLLQTNDENYTEGIESLPIAGLIYRFIYDEPSNTTQSKTELMWTVAPNPFSDFIRIDSPVAESGQVRILSSQGQLVYEQGSLVNNQIDLSRLLPGLYILEFEAQGKIGRTKIIKK